MISSSPSQAFKQTIQTPGRWRINWSVRHSGIATGSKVAGRLVKNGSPIKTITEATLGGATQSIVQDVTFATLAVGDVLTLEAWQNSGSANDVIGIELDGSPTPGQYVTFMQCRFLGN
jgi:hypothetical protein